MTERQPSQGGLYTQLEPLLAYRAVLITVSKIEGDSLQVNICPRQLKEGENALCVTGSAAELDGAPPLECSGGVKTCKRPDVFSRRFVSSLIAANQRIEIG